MSNPKQHYYQLLKKVHCESNKEVILKISEIIRPSSDEIAGFFYKTMLTHSKASYFINNDVVKRRLHKSLSNWINMSLLYKDNDEQIVEYIDYQLHIGHVHGRIDLPVSFINYGMYLIKEETSKVLKKSRLDLNQLSSGLVIMNQIFDIGLALMNESYQGDLVFNKKEEQAFKIQFSTYNLALDCEKLRTSLANWMRELLLTIQQENFDISQNPTIRHSDFGLWVIHKSKLFLSNIQYESLVQLLNNMDDVMIVLIAEFKQVEKRKANLMTLNIFISRALWIMDDISREIIDKDNGRDPLTRLFNRRYLETVLRHEADCSLQKNLVFGLIMLDIDFFKKINDAFGHNNGDMVLSQLAEILSHSVRAGDFVFRLGGEEFLVVLSDINPMVLEKIANKIRLEIENTPFILQDQQNLSVTVSAGVAIHDGHPDFQRTIKQADEALYEAKQNGRNRVIVAKQATVTYAELV